MFRSSSTGAFSGIDLELWYTGERRARGCWGSGMNCVLGILMIFGNDAGKKLYICRRVYFIFICIFTVNYRS